MLVRLKYLMVNCISIGTGNGSAFIQLFITKSKPGLILTPCQLDPFEQTSMECNLHTNAEVFPRKMYSKTCHTFVMILCLLIHFCQGSHRHSLLWDPNRTRPCTRKYLCHCRRYGCMWTAVVCCDTIGYQIRSRAYNTAKYKHFCGWRRDVLYFNSFR